MTRTIQVPLGVAAGRLDVYLAGELGLSRSAVQSAIKLGLITRGDDTIRPSQEPQAGQIYTITEPKPATVSTQPALTLPVIYEDDDMFVIDKPAGVVVHSGNAQGEIGTVAEWARSRTTDDDLERPGIVHRLDKETSGLLVIAKTTAAKIFLQQRWKERTVKKTYRVLVTGRIDPDAAVINLPLDRDESMPTRRGVRPNGRPAITRYQTVAFYPGYSYLEAYPETGRTHQLRVHFAAVGHPVAADIIYGVGDRPLGLKRQFLHAAALSLTTPSGKEINLISPLPQALETVLKSLTESV